VLLKRFPSWLNMRVHRFHSEFVLKNLPESTSSVLDIGCGYGRISREIRKKHPAAKFLGVELCNEFSFAYREEFGECFIGSIQDFQVPQHYDAIIIVTVLMYLNKDELLPTVEKYWSALAPGGVMICVEPAVEYLTVWRRLTGKLFASPTGGVVTHFQKPVLRNLFANLESAIIVDDLSVKLVPGVTLSSLHHGFAISKEA